MTLDESMLLKFTPIRDFALMGFNVLLIVSIDVCVFLGSKILVV